MTTLDLRHLALILDAGRKAAESFRDPASAPLVAALAHMTEVAAALHIGGVFDVDTDFKQIAEKYR